MLQRCTRILRFIFIQVLSSVQRSIIISDQYIVIDNFYSHRLDHSFLNDINQQYDNWLLFDLRKLIG